jgi:hypothetical protein
MTLWRYPNPGTQGSLLNLASALFGAGCFAAPLLAALAAPSSDPSGSDDRRSHGPLSTMGGSSWLPGGGGTGAARVPFSPVAGAAAPVFYCISASECFHVRDRQAVQPLRVRDRQAVQPLRVRDRQAVQPLRVRDRQAVQPLPAQRAHRPGGAERPGGASIWDYSWRAPRKCWPICHAAQARRCARPGRCACRESPRPPPPDAADSAGTPGAIAPAASAPARTVRAAPSATSSSAEPLATLSTGGPAARAAPAPPDLTVNSTPCDDEACSSSPLSWLGAAPQPQPPPLLHPDSCPTSSGTQPGAVERAVEGGRRPYLAELSRGAPVLLPAVALLFANVSLQVIDDCPTCPEACPQAALHCTRCLSRVLTSGSRLCRVVSCYVNRAGVLLRLDHDVRPPSAGLQRR